MAALTITRARKILGTLADGIPDEQLEKDIKVAEILKILFFKQHHSNRNRYNKTNNGKA